jgi:hypothetical protein
VCVRACARVCVCVCVCVCAPTAKLLHHHHTTPAPPAPTHRVSSMFASVSFFAGDPSGAFGRLLWRQQPSTRIGGLWDTWGWGWGGGEGVGGVWRECTLRPMHPTRHASTCSFAPVCPLLTMLK